MYDHFRSEMGIPESEVGIISCYWAQVAHIRQSLEEINPGYSSATVRTIDGYQGKEKDVIIVSMARSNLSWDLGMMDDVRRINVAITRAKVGYSSFLYVKICSETLLPYWRLADF